MGEGAIDMRQPPFDAVRGSECRERRDGILAVCKERHKNLDDRLERMDKKNTYILGVVTLQFLGGLVAIIKMFLSTR